MPNYKKLQAYYRGNAKLKAGLLRDKNGDVVRDRTIHNREQLLQRMKTAKEWDGKNKSFSY
jgi:hypothetical protein